MADTKLSALSAATAPALTDETYIVTTPGGTPTSASTTLANFLGVGLPSVCQGRLTLTTGTAFPTADVTAGTSVYWTPCNGAVVALYSGTTWILRSFSELSISLASGFTTGKNYDVFAYDNSGTVAIESLVWTNDTTRATALVIQDGIYVKSGATTRRYLGTFRTATSTTTADSLGGITTQVGGKRFLWNLYNQTRLPICVIDTASTWNYGTATYRIADAATAPSNCVEYVCGLAGYPLTATVIGTVFLISNSARGASFSIGLDSTTAFSGILTQGYNGSGNNANVALNANYNGLTQLGYHYVAWIEAGADGTCEFIGSTSGVRQSGLYASIQG